MSASASTRCQANTCAYTEYTRVPSRSKITARIGVPHRRSRIQETIPHPAPRTPQPHPAPRTLTPRPAPRAPHPPPRVRHNPPLHTVVTLIDGDHMHNHHAPGSRHPLHTTHRER